MQTRSPRRAAAAQGSTAPDRRRGPPLSLCVADPTPWGGRAGQTSRDLGESRDRAAAGPRERDRDQRRPPDADRPRTCTLITTAPARPISSSPTCCASASRPAPSRPVDASPPKPHSWQRRTSPARRSGTPSRPSATRTSSKRFPAAARHVRRTRAWITGAHAEALAASAAERVPAGLGVAMFQVAFGARGPSGRHVTPHRHDIPWERRRFAREPSGPAVAWAIPAAANPEGTGRLHRGRVR